MINFDGLEENLKFLTAEAENQVRSVYRFLENPDRSRYDRIINKDDYIDKLKTIIENKCFSIIHTQSSITKPQINKIRSIQTIGVNLERIADYCVNIARQMGYLDDAGVLREYEYEQVFAEIQNSIKQILPVLHDMNLSGALGICKTEYALDRIYKIRFDRIMAEIKQGRDVQRLITVLFIFRYLERIGDALLNIGEALIFSILGERIKIEQFEALQNTLEKSGFKEEIGDIDFQSIWGTRSGCLIGRLGQAEGNRMPDAQGSIFKEGTKQKISVEKENLKKWDAIYPGIAARIYGYHEDDDNASILVEFLPGCTLDEIIVASAAESLENAVFVLKQTVEEIWQSTRKEDPVYTDYMAQLESRFNGILRIHPDFRRSPKQIGTRRIPGTPELIQHCKTIESRLPAPFAVFIHGDFNINNIVYNHSAQRVHFIDLHRSRQFDYVQDISVFLISNFRMPLFEKGLRRRLNRMIQDVFDFAAGFARQSADRTFEARMALALTRSFYTSTRFELKQQFATEMYLRAHFVMEKLMAHQDRPWADFRLPIDVLFY